MIASSSRRGDKNQSVIERAGLLHQPSDDNRRCNPGGVAEQIEDAAVQPDQLSGRSIRDHRPAQRAEAFSEECNATSAT